MSIETNLQGRLRNTSLPVSGGLLPLFEAVSNSIHAVEDAPFPANNSRIAIKILREGQATFKFGGEGKPPPSEAKGEIVGFKIEDNGIGFNDENMESFLTLDSEYKASRGGRGIGRLLWLKAFKRATIESVFQADENGLKKRKFTFNACDGVSDSIGSDFIRSACKCGKGAKQGLF